MSTSGTCAVRHCRLQWPLLGTGTGGRHAALRDIRAPPRNQYELQGGGEPVRPLPLLPAATSPRRKAAPLPHVPTQRLRAMGAAALPVALHRTSTGASTHIASCPEHLRGTARRLQGGMGTTKKPAPLLACAPSLFWAQYLVLVCGSMYSQEQVHNACSMAT